MSSKKKTSSPPKNASTPKPAPAASRVNPGHACARWDFAAKSRGLTRDELVHLAVENFLQISNYTARPETPLLDALEEAEAFCFEHQISRQGIFLPTPGLLGNVEIPQATALRFMAQTLSNFEHEIMRIAVERYPSIRKEVADALLLAETIWMRTQPEDLKKQEDGLGETTAQLFSRWAMTGTDFAEFEKILAERDACAEVKGIRDAMVRADHKSPVAA